MRADAQTNAGAGINPQQARHRSDNILLIAVALLTVIVHILTGNRYGFHRDELATLDDARRPAWGYVAYPPITPFFGRLSLALFGTSLVGFRFFAFIAEAVAVVLTGLMARALGGRRGAQLIAATAAVPFALAGGALMQYVSFDYLCWVLTSYCVVRLLHADDSRWCLAIGASVGLGLLAKYGMAFFIPGIILGLLVSDARRHFKTKWFCLGITLALVIVLPNLIWQAQHDFISLRFLNYIHARDVRIGRTAGFLPDQLKLMLFSLPLVLAGLYRCLLSHYGRRFRALGIMYLTPLIIFTVAKGRGYYLAAAYPMLYAAGAVQGEQWLAQLRERWQVVAARTIAWTALAANVILVGAFFLPIAPVNSHWFAIASKVQGDYVEEIGWPELAQTAAQVRDALPPADRAHFAILAGNYGEAGALDLYGPQYQLPQVISGINSFWLRGYGDPPPQTVIVIGISRSYLEKYFSSCQLAGHTWNRYGVKNEETADHPDIFVCRGLKPTWPDFWSHFHYFG